MSEDDSYKTSSNHSGETSLSNDAAIDIAAGNSHDQISNSLTWLNERAWPLAGFVFFVPVIYLLSFIQEEKLPLSIASSSIISSLPVLFALILLCITLLVGLLLSPTMILFSPLQKNNSDRLIDSLISSDNSKKTSLPFPWKTIFAWMLAPIVLISIVAIISLFIEADDGGIHWSLQLLLIISIPVTAIIFILSVRKATGRNIRLRDISSDFCLSVLMGIVPQFLITTYVIIVSVRIADSADYPLAVIAVAAVIALAVLCPLQLIGATLIASVGRTGQSFKRALSIGCLIIVLLGLYPPTAAWLAGSVFQLTSSGGRPCAILSFHSIDSIEKSIIDTEYGMKSKPLRILIDVDGYFWVRPKDILSKDIYLVSHEATSRISECAADKDL